MKGVVVCPQVEAVEVGRHVLENGGNAVDAAVATAFAQGIADPMVTSIGGNGTLQVLHAPTGQHVVIDFYGRAPLAATPDMWAGKVIQRLPADSWELEGRINQQGYLAVTVPGTLMALHEVASRFGTMPWEELLRPAINLADAGFTVPGELAASWVREGTPGYSSYEEILNATPASIKVFTREGRPIEAGEHFAMKDYADTLRRVARDGPTPFTGAISPASSPRTLPVTAV